MASGKLCGCPVKGFCQVTGQQRVHYAPVRGADHGAVRVFELYRCQERYEGLQDHLQDHHARHHRSVYRPAYDPASAEAGDVRQPDRIVLGLRSVVYAVYYHDAERIYQGDPAGTGRGGSDGRGGRLEAVCDSDISALKARPCDDRGTQFYVGVERTADSHVPAQFGRKMDASAVRV